MISAWNSEQILVKLCTIGLFEEDIPFIFICSWHIFPYQRPFLFLRSIHILAQKAVAKKWMALWLLYMSQWENMVGTYCTCTSLDQFQKGNCERLVLFSSYPLYHQTLMEVPLLPHLYFLFLSQTP